MQSVVVDVAWVTVRRAEDGKKRYQGRYRDASGAKRTVGTFGTDKAAMQAAVRAEIAPVSYTHLTLPTNREV